MIETATPAAELKTVASIEMQNGAVELVFAHGPKVNLAADHPDREAILNDANRSLRYRQPVGLQLDSAGRLLDLRYAIQTSVHRVLDCEEDPNRLEVWFWGYSPVCYVRRDHPDFERIRTTLEHAVASGNRVWLATHTWPETSETEIWMKIMDVRPGDWAETSPLRNGAA